ncbi:MAG: hypothetical protein KDA61_06040, partial [Planctomycetales bacterium]|nr:hypothetical protein [Planctomycetales bacterium]
MNDAVNQVRDLFASMTPAARITSALLLGVIAVSLGYLTQGFAGSADEPLFNGEFLRPREADAVHAAVSQANLTGLRRDGNRFFVPRGQSAPYLAAIADAGALPANFDTLLEDTLTLSPFVSHEEREQRIKSIRERKIAMFLRNMQGVEDAQVMYDMRESRGFGKPIITATVSVQPSGASSLDAHRIKMIRAAVAGSISGLDPGNVQVLNLADGTAFGGGGNGINPEMFDDPYFNTRIKYEQLMKQNIEGLLSYIPGVSVQVTAELDESIEKTTKT